MVNQVRALLVGFGFLLFSGCLAKAPPAPLKPANDFSSPEKTFETWRYAVSELNFPLLLQCYAVSARPQIELDIKNNSDEGLKAMQREARETKFEIQKIVFEEKRAYLRVERIRNKVSEIEIVNMVKESGLWKIMP